MRLLIFISVFTLLSCNQKSSDKRPVNNDTATHPVVNKDSITKTTQAFYTTPDEMQVNQSLAEKSGNKLQVMNDREAEWPKDVFDYFIAPKRKENPDYPYIIKGDFNSDGKTDTAALVTAIHKKDFRIAILMGSGKIELWGEDVLVNAALSTVPRGMIEGGDIDHPKKIKMKGDGINVEYFEKASFVIYWNGSSFKRIQAGD